MTLPAKSSNPTMSRVSVRATVKGNTSSTPRPPSIGSAEVGRPRSTPVSENTVYFTPVGFVVAS